VRSAIEQRHAQLFLQRLDLMTHGRGSNEQLFSGGLEAQAHCGNLKGLEKFE